MTMLSNLYAPDALPDPSSPAYRAVRDILDDHPVTGSMAYFDRAALARRLADTLGELVRELEAELAEVTAELTLARSA